MAEVPTFGQTLSDSVIEEMLKKAIQENDKDAFALATHANIRLYERPSKMRKWIDKQRSELYKGDTGGHEILADTFSSLLEHGNIDKAIDFFIESELVNMKSGIAKDTEKTETAEEQEKWFTDYMARDKPPVPSSSSKTISANRAVLRVAPRLAIH